MRRGLLGLALVLAACSTDSDAASTTAPPTSTTIPTTAPTTTTQQATTTTSDLAQPTDIVTGAPLPPSPQRHQEGEPVVGTPSPTLTFGDLSVPSDRPTLLLTVVGSCADCLAASQFLQPLVDEFDAVAVLVTSDAPATDLGSPWRMVVDEAAARAFSGRDRPTALVIGPTGTVLSRIRPFNQSGATYDEEDLRFALQIATNQQAGTPPAPAAEPVVGDRLDNDLPATFFATTADGSSAVEVSTLDGSVVRRIDQLPIEPGDEIAAQVVDHVIPVPGAELVLINECCEPAGGNIRAVPIGPDDPTRDPPWFGGWEVEPSGDGTGLVFSGYFRHLFRWDPLAIAESGTLPDSIWDEAVPLGGSNGSNPDVAWLRDRSGVVYLHRGNERGVVEIIELDADDQPISRRNFELAAPASAVAVNADGNIVVASSAFGSAATVGQIYDSNSGELLAEFPLADGTDDIAYDTLGRYLISVDGDGVVSWQGSGGTGTLGNGYASADW